MILDLMTGGLKFDDPSLGLELYQQLVQNLCGKSIGRRAYDKMTE